MPDKLYWDILDTKRKEILPLFNNFKEDYYLAGGTALALQLGRRDSVDFDFFSSNNFSTNELSLKIEKIFKDHKIIKTQEEKDTLTFLLDDTIKISFFCYPYKLIKPLINTTDIKLASVEDIGSMKLSAITSRSLKKDYVDLYFILQKISLEELLEITKTKFPSLDINLILKSLVYFDDITDEPIIYKNNHEIEFEKIEAFLKETVNKYLSN